VNAVEPCIIILKIFRSTIDLFPESSARDPNFFGNPQAHGPDFSGNIWVSGNQFDIAGISWGCRPHTFMNEHSRRT
jgi:hypothetical protein